MQCGTASPLPLRVTSNYFPINTKSSPGEVHDTPFAFAVGRRAVGAARYCQAQAAPAADLSQLGNRLTPIGAEKAGNADGSIPAWTGGLTQAPTGWSAGHGNPYASDKPLYSIDSRNLAQYQQLLPAGQAALIKAYPGYRLDVYPTRRSCPIPAEVAERTRTFAGQARIGSDGWRLEQAAGAAVPFPIPQNGIEAMWNYKLRYMAKGRRAQISFLLRERMRPSPRSGSGPTSTTPTTMPR